MGFIPSGIQELSLRPTASLDPLSPQLISKSEGLTALTKLRLSQFRLPENGEALQGVYSLGIVELDLVHCENSELALHRHGPS